MSVISPLPELTLDMVLNNQTSEYFPRHVMDVLDKNQYVHIGWLNSGIRRPLLNDWTRVYKNWSGSHCIYVSPSTKQVYSVDMGD